MGLPTPTLPGLVREGVPEMRRRLRGAQGRAAVLMFDSAARVVGMRPEFVPGHFRRQLEVVGITEPVLAGVLGSIRGVADWPYAWEHAADVLVGDGDLAGASAAYYVAQRVLVTETPLKRRLYRQAVECYHAIEHDVPVERFEVARGDQRIAGLLQVPAAPASQGAVPLVLVVPGITAAKEEAHLVADLLLPRGYAVARIDNPGYGETSGVIDAGSTSNVAAVLDHLRDDPRIDGEALHVLGFSMGAYLALHGVAAGRAASVITVSAPFDPARYPDRFAGASLRAMQQVTGLATRDEMLALYGSLRLEDVLGDVDCPVRMFHGGKDGLIPASEMQLIAERVGGGAVTTLYPDERHVCVGEVFTIMAELLEWCDDPHGLVERADGAPATGW